MNKSYVIFFLPECLRQTLDKGQMNFLNSPKKIYMPNSLVCDIFLNGREKIDKDFDICVVSKDDIMKGDFSLVYKDNSVIQRLIQSWIQLQNKYDREINEFKEPVNVKELTNSDFRCNLLYFYIDEEKELVDVALLRDIYPTTIIIKANEEEDQSIFEMNISFCYKGLLKENWIEEYCERLIREKVNELSI